MTKFWDFIFNVVQWFTDLTPEKAIRAGLVILIVALTFYNYHQNNVAKESRVLAETRYVALQQELKNCSDLNHQFELFKSEVRISLAFKRQFPVAMWRKTTKSIYVEVNEVFEKKYLYPNGLTSNIFLANNGILLWGDSLENIFKVEDSLVMYNDRPMIFVNSIKGRKRTTLKWPWKSEGYLLGINGMDYDYFEN